MFRLKDLAASEDDLEMTQPRMYYGERNDVPFVVMNTSTQSSSTTRTRTGTIRPRRRTRAPAVIALGGFFQPGRCSRGTP